MPTLPSPALMQTTSEFVLNSVGNPSIEEILERSDRQAITVANWLDALENQPDFSINFMTTRNALLRMRLEESRYIPTMRYFLSPDMSKYQYDAAYRLKENRDFETAWNIIKPYVTKNFITGGWVMAFASRMETPPEVAKRYAALLRALQNYPNKVTTLILCCHFGNEDARVLFG